MCDVNGLGKDSVAEEMLREDQERRPNWMEISTEVGNAGIGRRETNYSKAQWQLYFEIEPIALTTLLLYTQQQQEMCPNLCSATVFSIWA